MLYILVDSLGTGLSRAATICDQTEWRYYGKVSYTNLTYVLALNLGGGRDMPGPSHWASPGPKGPVDHWAVLCQTTGSLADLRQWDIHTTRAHLDLLMDNIEVP